MEPLTSGVIEQVSYLCDLYKQRQQTNAVPPFVVQKYCVDVATQYGVPEFADTIYSEKFSRMN